MFLYAPCYIKLLRKTLSINNLGLDLIFIEQSQYEEANEARINNPYPIGVLEDIEIHFLHYNNEEDAKSKWTERTKRVNWNNLLVKFCHRDNCTEQLLLEFDKLNFKKKVCFTAKNYPQFKSTVWFSEYKDALFVDNELTIYKKYFNVVSWLNNK